MDLGQKLGCTPSWWQLWKALHEAGHEVVVTPYLGDPVEGLWWRTYPNPCRNESLLFKNYLDTRRARGFSPARKTAADPFLRGIIQGWIRPRWKAHLERILSAEKDFDATLFMNVPVNHITGIPGEISREFGIPVVYYDGDMPSALPEYAEERGLRFNYYEGAELSEFDLFLVNSEAVASRLKEMGAQRVSPFHYAIDPGLFSPITVPKEIDIAYYALGSTAREEWMSKMIAIPSDRLPDRRFRVAGGQFHLNLGRAKHVGDLTYSQYRKFCCSSVVNLNITSRTHSRARGTSTSRPFELAAFGACMVSQPYDGIERWFEPDKELFVVKDDREIVPLYEGLLDDKEQAEEVGRRARARVLREHTYKHRADELLQMMASLS